MKKMKKKKRTATARTPKSPRFFLVFLFLAFGNTLSGIQSFSYSSSKDEENHPPTPDTMRDFIIPLPSPFFFTRTERSTEKDQEATHRYETTMNGLGFGASSSSNYQQKQVQKIVHRLLSKEEDNKEGGEGFAQTSMNIVRDDVKANFFYGYAESDKWYEREQIGKEEFGTGKIADTKHHVIKTKIRTTQELQFGATVVEHPDPPGMANDGHGEPEKSLNAKQEAMRILEAQRRAKEELLALNTMRTTTTTTTNSVETEEKIAAREAKRKAHAEQVKQKRREKRRSKNSFQNMERFKRDAIVSGERMGCELCDSIAIECFKELRWKYLMERNAFKNNEYEPAEKAVMSCLVSKCGGVTANPANAMKNRAVVPVPKPPMTDNKNNNREDPQEEQNFGLASIELSTIRAPMTHFDSYALTTACEEAFDVQTRNDVASKIANALKDLRDRDEFVRSERARRGEITSKTTKKDLLAEDAIGINAAKLGCAFVCELNKMHVKDESKEEEIEVQQCSSGFSKEEGEGEDGQPPPPPKCATPEDVPDTAANDFDDDDNDDDYEEDVNSRERHDEDANRNTRDAHPPRFFTRAQHSKARFLARSALRKLGCHRSSSGWWSYEICFEQNITQYHATFDNAQKRVVIDTSTQSSLGTFSASGTEARLHALYGGNDHSHRHQHHQNHHHAPGRDGKDDAQLLVDGFVPDKAFLPGMTKTLPGYVVAHLKGAYCDAINAHRESVVLYACSNDLQTHVKVYEQKTCKYIVVVFVKELCVFKHFQREENVLIRAMK